MLNQRRLRRGIAILTLLSACAIIPQYLAPAAAAPKQVKEGWTRIGAQPQKSHAAALMSDTPATFALLIGLFAFFAVIRVKRWTGDTVGASAESIEGRQYWRLVTSGLAHLDAVHIVFNLSTAYSLGPALERRHGSAALLLSTAALVVFVGLVAASLTRHGGGAVGAWHLGFSGVLFAWITDEALMAPQFCPVADWCFATMRWGPLAFNAGPLVYALGLQLVASVLSIPLSLAGHVAGVICGAPFAAGLLDGVAAPALALGVLACVDSTRHARRPSLRLALVAAALATLLTVAPPQIAVAAAAAGVAASLSREWCPLGLACAAACVSSGAGVLAAIAAESATDPTSFLLAGAAAALTAMAWATRLGFLAGAPLAVAALASATAASTAAWLAEDLRGAADASTPGWAALKRFLGPPDGEVVLRDGRIVKRATVVDV
jgi:membrane associated rhomboid family serine protease